MEEFKEIPGFEGRYLVSNYGRVKSIGRYIGTGKGYFKPESILIKSPDKDGYMMVSISIPNSNRKNKTLRVHQQVARCFIKSVLTDGEIVCHLDGDILNNRLDNLYIGDIKTNTLDKYRHGTTKLTIENVIFIRNNYGKYKQKELSTMFDVSQGTISNIISRNRAKFI